MKVLIVYRKTATEALKHLDEFESKMNTFIELNKEYSFTSSLKKLKDKWEIKVTVNDEKRGDIKAT